MYFFLTPKFDPNSVTELFQGSLKAFCFPKAFLLASKNISLGDKRLDQKLPQGPLEHSFCSSNGPLQSFPPPEALVAFPRFLKSWNGKYFHFCY